MATPTYTVKVLKVDKATLDLEVKAALDEYVYCWPSLAVRALADGPGSPLSALDLSTCDGVAAAAEAWIDHVEVLATRKGLAQYRICAKTSALFAGLKKGATWPSSAMHADGPSYGPGALAADGKLAAVIVNLGSVVRCGAIELLAMTKKGPGATKGWLTHIGVIGVGALGSRIVSWSPDQVRVWSVDQDLLAEHNAAVTCASLTKTGVAIGTKDGLLLDKERVDVGPVSALAYADDLLYVLTGGGEVIVLSDGVEKRRFKAEPGDTMAVSGADLAIAGDDGHVRWFRSDEPIGTINVTSYHGQSVHSAARVQGGIAVAVGRGAYCVYGDGRVQELALTPAPQVTQISAEAGLVMAMTHGDVARARIWREDGALVGELVLPRSRLHRAQMSPRPHSTRLTRDGAWVLCAEGAHEKGGVRLIGTRGQGQVRFPNPNQSYDFLTDVEEIGAETFLVGYGNHDALLWTLDGKSRSLGVRIDCIWTGGGRLLTNKDKEITEWDADLKPLRSFSVGVPYGLHWLEGSTDGRFVVSGAQPQAWVRDLETGEEWELTQPGGVDAPMFAGHSRYLLTNNVSEERRVRIWDVIERRIVTELSGLFYAYMAQWLSEDTLMVASTTGVWAVNLRGEVRPLLDLSGGDTGPTRVSGIGFDRKGNLMTAGERSHLYAWSNPNQSKSHGGYWPPFILDYEPGWCVSCGQWPALPMRMPG